MHFNGDVKTSSDTDRYDSHRDEDEHDAVWKLLSSPQMQKWQKVEIEFNESNTTTNRYSTTTGDSQNKPQSHMDSYCKVNIKIKRSTLKELA